VDLALIGNGSYQALIDSQGHVRWLCWPRFDSSFVFGGLLDEERGGVFAVEPAAAGASSEQHYLPHTNVLRTSFRAGDGSYEVLDLAPRFGRGEQHRAPNALLRIVRPTSGQPQLRVRCAPTGDYGRVMPPSRSVDGGLAWDVDGAELVLETDAPTDDVAEGRPFTLQREHFFLLRGSEPLELGPAELLERTTRYWQGWSAALCLPGVFDDEVVRSALTLALHQYQPTGAITAAATTSLPEYPGSGRNWDYRYCWLRDAYFTLQALERVGRRDETRAFAAFVQRITTASPVGLQPLFGIAGERCIEERVLHHLSGYRGDGPVRIGNAAYAQAQNDVYGETIAALEPLLEVGELPSALLLRLVDDIARTLEQPDAGLWEIRDEPKLHAFSLLMHWFGGKTAARIARRLSDDALAIRAGQLADRARTLLDTRCWRPQGYYADAATTDHADAALLMMINLGFLEPGDPRASSHVDHLVERLALGDALMSRYLHHDGIGETHASFTVCAFWLVEALARLGRREEAEARMRTLLGYANHVGLFGEDIDPHSGEQLGNFPQTYSHAALISAAFALAKPPRPATPPAAAPPTVSAVDGGD
jgi:GH15 family glucan-1,4-alpha-glucosidase